MTARQVFFDLYLKMRAAYRVINGLRSVGNKLPAIRHILGRGGGAGFVYELPHGIHMYVGNSPADRTVIFSVREIFDQEVYKMPGCEDSRVIVDLGANVGVFTLYASQKYPQAKIISVEAGSDNADYLARSIVLNSLSDRVSVMHAAVWETDGELTLYRNDVTSRAHSVMWNDEGGAHKDSERVKSLSLKNLFELNGIESCDLLKMDIEGAEYQVLYGTPPEVLQRVKAIVMEYHHDSRARCDCDGLRAFFQENGFRQVQSRIVYGVGYGILTATR